MNSADGRSRTEDRKPFAMRLRGHVLAIAMGEGVARLCNLLLIVFISRRFGVRAAGAYAVAQALSLYQMYGIDFGLRQTGARLVARYPRSVRQVMRFVQRRRVILGVMTVIAGCCYGRFGPVPQDARQMVSLYALAAFGYSISVDWLAWGMQRFARMSGWRAMVSMIAMTVTVVCVVFYHAGLLIVPFAAGLAYLTAGAWLWISWGRKLTTPEADTENELKPSAFPNWKSTAMLGAALLMYQAFSSIDTMMLGGMTDSVQTGLYSAAYRLLLLVLAVYYFIMQAAYPRLAAIPEEQRQLHPLRRSLSFAVIAGVVIASLMWMARRLLIEMLFGPAFAAAAALAAPLLFAIPLDFVTSVLLTVLIAWNHPGRVIVATGTAVATNVGLNLFLIPRYGAIGAAYATPLSYLPFLIVLMWQLHCASKRDAQAVAMTDEIPATLIS